MTKTLQYYNKNAQDFISGTKEVGFSNIQTEFIKYVIPGGRILDFGCGAGRDSKAFMSMGFEVEATDGSDELCRLTSEFLGVPVKKLLFNQLDEQEEYDGIWACASILHVPYDELSDILDRIEKALKPGGVFYCSFKYGEFEGERNERFFTDMNHQRWEKLTGGCKMTAGKIWITSDVRAGRENEKWFNVIMIKE